MKAGDNRRDVVRFTKEQKAALRMEGNERNRPVKQALLEGYGFDANEINKMIPVIECMADTDPGCSDKIAEFISEKLNEKGVDEL